MSIKVEKPENYNGDKVKDLDTWLFQVREHLELSTVPTGAYVAYAASLLRGNAAMWWREACEAHRQPATSEDFCRTLCDQFRPEYYGRCGCDKLATMQQYARESVTDFVYRFRATYLKVSDLSKAEKVDRFFRTLV